ncbi:MAG: ClbS/DfsB family four-helix bundle protein, partial [Ktedonobacteraceae bacterium]|nr:ClbS/DfsB family four-helix bundle protein [Ktedonobacteraceae bacterium]
LSEEQLTTSGVNGAWSIKDNIAHLTEWQKYLLEKLKAANAGVQMVDLYPDMGEDEINEFFYQRNKSRPLADVLAEFRAVSLQVVEAVEQTSEDILNGPLPWPTEDIVANNIMGNTYEHCEEHSQIIRDWLASGQRHA